MSTLLTGPRSDRPSLVVGRYALYEAFASDATRTTHFAQLSGARGFRRIVVAERIAPEIIVDSGRASLLAALALEVERATRVRHRHVVSVLDVVREDGELLLVTEYVHGETLADLTQAARLRGGCLPPSIATALMADVLHGLHAIHEARDERGRPLAIVHGRLRPECIVVGADGAARVGGLGSARLQRVEEERGRAACHLAPELRPHGPASCAGDVYAAASILWELLSGPVAARAPSRVRLVSARAGSALSPELEAVVARGVADDPAERYASPREMALALDRAIELASADEVAAWVERCSSAALARRAYALEELEEPARASTESPPTALVPRAMAAISERRVEVGARSPRRRPVLLLGALLTVAAVGAGSWIAHQTGRAHPAEPPPAEPPYDAATDDAGAAG